MISFELASMVNRFQDSRPLASSTRVSTSSRPVGSATNNDRPPFAKRIGRSESSAPFTATGWLPSARYREMPPGYSRSATVLPSGERIG